MAVAPLASGKPWRNLGLLTIGYDGRRRDGTQQF